MLDHLKISICTRNESVLPVVPGPRPIHRICSTDIYDSVSASVPGWYSTDNERLMIDVS